MPRGVSARWLSLGCVLAAAVAVGCFVQAWHRADTYRVPAVLPSTARLAPAPATPAASASPVPSLSASDMSQPRPADGAAQSDSPPVRVAVPVIGLAARVVPVGVASDGSIAVPRPAVAGWYRLGPAPGEVGPAVIVGHIDSRTGPAVFYRLNAVQAGDIIDITRADGTAASFTVEGITRVRKTRFPTAAVFAPTAVPTLRLVTCTGTFDRASGNYLDSLIVWAAAAPSSP